MNKNCNYNRCNNTANSSYLKWVLEVLGPVIMGSKPSEILNISFNDPMKDEKISDLISFFSKCNKISFEIINQKEKGIKILFLNYCTLKQTLNNKKIINFLKFLGYPKNYDFHKYLDFLIKKLKSNILPDEIGIFLGYPLKDVVGFMGYGNYKFQNTKYWRIYGDPNISQQVYDKFLEHRKQMRELIAANTTEYILKAI
ncbi:DUF3793 family protein [Romboutsia sedimentorum]|jgi:hypothetical protein|uniref:DUF3793 family protein n=1 Tax=Romboutsia sedimentorum TaxID=1368474 RepID=A0ABT7EAT2_9FIRM|nr:DUF3793 family protein [Romboutsia sedimentorum]MDK2564039.1 DUF3793 family protein [Romboutsia sedimentorum]